MENKLSLNLSQISSILDGITCYEKIDIFILDKLINSNLLKETFHNPFISYQNEKTQLIKYKELVQNNTAHVKYIKSTNNPFGRSNPLRSLGLFSIRREIRHTLAKNFYVDIDIVNCHPTILYQICEHNNIKCDILKDYVINRQKYLDIIMNHYNVDKDIAKNLFIRILYGGNFNSWMSDNNIINEPLQFIIDFKNEFNNISSIIVENNEEIKKYVIDTKETQNKPLTNLAGSVSSFFLQEYEIRILSELFNYCVQKGYIIDNNCVLCADGLMIDKQIYKQNILSEFNLLIKDKLGFDLNFINKEMNQDYLPILDKNISVDLYNPPFTSGMIADYFKLLYGDKYLYCNNQLYIYTGVYWKKDDKKYSSLNNFVDDEFYHNLVFYINNLLKLFNVDININKEKINKINILLKNVQNLRSIRFREAIICDILNKITNNDITFDSNPNLIAFNNKIYDLNNSCWIEPKYDQYIQMTVGYNYNDLNDINKLNELDKLLDTIFPDKNIKEYYLMILSTGMYGEQLENLFIATGEGGNGKSLINSLMCEMLGEYAYKLPSNVLLQEIQNGGNPQIALLNNKRFVLCQEPNKNRRICSSTLKEITGDKTLNARKLHSNECIVRLKLTLILECNELPQIDEVGQSINRRIRVIPFVSKFVNKEIYDNLVDKTNVFIGNPYYKTNDFQLKYKQTLFDLLCKYYVKFKNNGYKLLAMPNECKIKSNEYLACSDDIYDWFSTIYELDNQNKNNEPIKISEIYEHFASSSIFSNMSKVDKRKYTLKHFNEKIKTNIFLQNYYKQKNSYINKIHYTVPTLIKFKKIDKTDVFI